jgi:hypothetical protein
MRQWEELLNVPEMNSTWACTHAAAGKLREKGAQPLSKALIHAFFLALAAAGSAHAQAPTGTLAGVVTDPAGARVPEAQVSIINRETGLARTFTTSAEGDYSAAAALPPGIYQVTVKATGFRQLERAATVEAGTTTTVDLMLQLGGATETVTVKEDALPLIRYDHHQVGGLVSRRQIENLPLNGRSFLELAKLEPGVQPPARASSNRTFVPALGQPVGNSGRGTRVTVDGGSVFAGSSSGVPDLDRELRPFNGSH